MTDIQGAFGSAQMDRAAEIVAERQRLAGIYDRAFSGLDWLRTPVSPEGYEHGYQSYPCVFRPDNLSSSNVQAVNAARNAWMEELQNAGISTRPATHAVHMLSYYKNKYNIRPTDFPNARACF